ncbi:hypothetical protein SNEBB_009405 [Seison nebaliae]|nr:hypothetical protein SNEBB_009405 [Seison nebaliae]
MADNDLIDITLIKSDDEMSTDEEHHHVRNKNENMLDWTFRRTDIVPYNIIEVNNEIMEFNLPFIRAKFGNLIGDKHMENDVIFRQNKGISFSFIYRYDDGNPTAVKIVIGKDDIVYCLYAVKGDNVLLIIKVTEKFANLFRRNVVKQNFKFDVNSNEFGDKFILILANVSPQQNDKLLCSILQTFFTIINPSKNYDYIKHSILCLTDSTTSKCLYDIFDQDDSLIMDFLGNLYDEFIQIKQNVRYPMPPQTELVRVTNDDAITLNRGRLLNDTIIEFYLIYMFYERLTEQQRERTYIYSTYFYSRLVDDNIYTREQYSIKEKRYYRIKGWTKSVNVFNKDFLLIPINQNCHWYIVIICYPNAIESSTNVNDKKKKIIPPDFDGKKALSILESGSARYFELALHAPDNNLGTDEEEADEKELKFFEISQKVHRYLTEKKRLTEANCRHLINKLYEKEFSKKLWNEEILIERRPCMLVFNSLPNSTFNARAVSTIRRYIIQEYVHRYCQNQDRSYEEKLAEAENKFNHTNFPSCVVNAPYQTNDYDCGIHMLMNAEYFFKEPITDYQFPIFCHDWYKEEEVNKKRIEIHNIIRKLAKRNLESVQHPN